MRTKLVNTAADVINRALLQGRCAASVAIALDSAGLLMSPETAAELSVLREDIATADQDVVEAQRHNDATCEAVKERDELRARVAELVAADVTVYRAQHDSIPMGLYTNREAARAHCEAEIRRNIPGASLDWIADDEDEEDGVAELVAAFGEDERSTGYVVEQLTAQAAYDEEADE